MCRCLLIQRWAHHYKMSCNCLTVPLTIAVWQRRVSVHLSVSPVCADGIDSPHRCTTTSAANGDGKRVGGALVKRRVLRAGGTNDTLSSDGVSTVRIHRVADSDALLHEMRLWGRHNGAGNGRGGGGGTGHCCNVVRIKMLRAWTTKSSSKFSSCRTIGDGIERSSFLHARCVGLVYASDMG